MRTRRKRERRTVPSAELDRIDARRALYAAEEIGASRAALHREVREAVEQALTDKQREVVEACFFEGLSQGEIARRLGISQQVVDKRIFGATRGGKRVGGALARLREVLAPSVQRRS